jgi:hypothetical protein
LKKFGPVGLKWLKILHLLLVTLFFGGIMSSTALNFSDNLAVYESTFQTYKSIVIISDYIIRIGAVGTLVIAFIYGFLTKWGFYKHRWLTVKWILFIGQTLLGIFVVDELMMSNMAILEAEKINALDNPVFNENHEYRNYAVILQIIITVFIFIISALKPWKKKKIAQQ